MSGFRPLGAFPLGGMPPHIIVAVAMELSAGTPALGTPALAQVNALTATAGDSAAPVLGSPALVQAQVLAANGLVGSAPTLASPTLTQLHALIANGIDCSAAALASPALVQAQVLTASGLVSSVPVLGAPAMLPVEVLLASALASAAPLLSSPAIFQVHVLYSGVPVTLGAYPLGALPLGAQPVAGNAGVRTGLDLGAPALGVPPLLQVHYLTANGIVFGTPVLGGAVLVTPAGIFAKYGGVWQAPIAYGRHDGDWKDVTEAYRHNADAWELIYERAP